MFDAKNRRRIKELEEELSLYSQKLEWEKGRASAVLSGMAEGVLAVDKNSKIILANPAIEKMFSVTEPEILGKTVREAVRNNEIADLVEEAKNSPQPIEKEIEIIVPFESTFIAHASPMSESSGAVCVLHDVTELKKLERYRSDFVANISHELKTPLTAIRNYVETLLLGALDDKENNISFLNKIEKHAVNLSELISDILEISKLESKKEAKTLVQVNLGKLVSRAVEAVRERAEKKNITIKKENFEEDFLVLGSEELLYRAVFNLLDNAVKYTEAGGEIEVSCDKNNRETLISVSDNGIGISSNDLPRIFERFYRTDKARSREQGGTGLGLAIVKHIMNVHSGLVDVKSELGKGSVFTLIFPR